MDESFQIDGSIVEVCKFACLGCKESTIRSLVSGTLVIDGNEIDQIVKEVKCIGNFLWQCHVVLRCTSIGEFKEADHADRSALPRLVRMQFSWGRHPLSTVFNPFTTGVEADHHIRMWLLKLRGKKFEIGEEDSLERSYPFSIICCKKSWPTCWFEWHINNPTLQRPIANLIWRQGLGSIVLPWYSREFRIPKLLALAQIILVILVKKKSDFSGSSVDPVYDMAIDGLSDDVLGVIFSKIPPTTRYGIIL